MSTCNVFLGPQASTWNDLMFLSRKRWLHFRELNSMNDRKVQVPHQCFVPGLSFKFSFKKTSDCFAGLCIVYSLMEFTNLIRVLWLWVLEAGVKHIWYLAHFSSLPFCVLCTLPGASGCREVQLFAYRTGSWAEPGIYWECCQVKNNL